MLSLLPALALAAILPLQDDAPAAGTDATVRAFLDEATASIYDPAEHGLVGISFKVPYIEPKANLNTMFAMTGQALPEGLPDEVVLATISVSWKDGTPPEITAEMTEHTPQQLVPMINMQSQGMAMQTLGAARHKLLDFEGLLRAYDARLDGTEDGLVKVLFERKRGPEGQMAPSDEMVWLFDEDGLPKRSTMQMPPSQMTAGQPVDLVREFGIGSNGGETVITSYSESMSIMGSEVREMATEFSYAERDGVLVLESFVETVTPKGIAAMQMPKAVKTVKLTDIQVEKLAATDEG